VILDIHMRCRTEGCGGNGGVKGSAMVMEAADKLGGV